MAAAAARSRAAAAARNGLHGVAGGGTAGFARSQRFCGRGLWCRAAAAQRWRAGAGGAVVPAVSCGNWAETRYTALWRVEPAKPIKYPHAARQAVSGPYRAGKRANSRSRSPALAAGQSNTQPMNRTFVPRPAGNPDFVTWITAPRACERATCARAPARSYQAKKAACPVNRCDRPTRAKRAARRSERE